MSAKDAIGEISAALEFREKMRHLASQFRTVGETDKETLGRLAEIVAKLTVLVAEHTTPAFHREVLVRSAYSVHPYDCRRLEVWQYEKVFETWGRRLAEKTTDVDDLRRETAEAVAARGVAESQVTLAQNRADKLQGRVAELEAELAKRPRFESGPPTGTDDTAQRASMLEI